MAVINQFVVKDAVTIRDDILRTIKNGLYQQGVSDPNVGPGSDFFDIATALGNELAVVGANGVIKTDAQMPDTATDDEDPNGDQDLTRIATLLGLEPQPATGSVGFVIIDASATSPIAVDTELTDKLGQRYKVTVGGSYADGASVPIEAISTGESTNLDEGETLQWAEAPPYCAETVTVGTGGLINGADAEDSEALRQRIFAKLQDRSTMAGGAFGALSDGIAASVSAAIDGSENIGKAFAKAAAAALKATAVQASVSALWETAKGIAALAVGSPSAGAHFKAAAVFAATAVAAGVGSAAFGAAGGGGASAIGANTGAGAAGGLGGRSSGGANGQGNVTYIINVNGYVGDEKKLGEEIERKRQAAHRAGRSDGSTVVKYG